MAGEPTTLRVLFCTLDYYPSTSSGGAERQARLQARALVQRGHRVTVVCPRIEGLPNGWIEGVEVVRLPRLRPPLRRISYLVVLLAFLLRRARSYDLIHVHLANVQADVVTFVANVLRRPVYVKVACGGSAGEVARMRKVAPITRWYGLRHATRVQALSDEIAAELRSVGVPPERIVRIPNGIDLGSFGPSSDEERERLRDELDLPQGGPLALFVGRFAQYKGIEDLLGAWRGMERDGATLVLVGSDAIDRPLDERPSGPQVVVRGWTDRVVDYLRAADIYVHPTHADGMSNAVLEAMACSLAIAASRHGATENFMRDGEDALLFQPKDENDLARTLSTLVVDGQLRGRLGESAREMAERYAIDGVVDRIEDAYSEMVRDRADAGTTPG
jgi:glycosyltransferase involved in cell wall biosynthesis